MTTPKKPTRTTDAASERVAKGPEGLDRMKKLLRRVLRAPKPEKTPVK